VLDKPFGPFTETALVRVAQAEFDNKEYQDAVAHFKELDEIASYPENRAYALSGLMRCAFVLENYTEAIASGNRLLQSDQVTSQLINEVHVTLARGYYELGDFNNSAREYRITRSLVQNEWAAESQYFTALFLYRENKAAEAEVAVFELADKYGSYDYWVARGFILLADIYAYSGDTFQAKQTLQSIIDNYSGADLVNEAKEKLASIIKMEGEVENNSGDIENEE